MIEFLKKLFGRHDMELAAHALYTALVGRARSPALYLEGGVKDTLDGRFDLIVLHLWAVVHRLHRPRDDEQELRQDAGRLEERLLALHFADMDQALSEMGVGDLGVGKRVKDMAQAFYGRARAYDAALEDHAATGEATGLEQALSRNVYRGCMVSVEASGWLRDYVLDLHGDLERLPLRELIAGRLAAAGADAGR